MMTTDAEVGPGIVYTFSIAGGSVKVNNENIIHVIAIGRLDNDEVDELHEVYLKILSLTKGTLNVLVDLNMADKSSPYARNLYKKMTEHDRIGKVALIGLHPVARVLASFIVGRTKRNNTRFFEKEEAALMWFKK